MRGPAILIAAMVLLVGARAAAQTNTAEISGVVRDTQGGVIPGATVVAEQRASGLKVQRITNQVGRFLLTALPVGEYTLVVELEGFGRWVQNGVVLRLGQQLELSVTLTVGGLAEAVTVSTDAPILQTATSDVSEVITNQQVVSLPLNGRQFLQLALLTDNVVVPPGGTRGAALQQAGSLFNVAGQRSGHNIYLLDGVKVTDEYFNNMVVSLSPDAIQEFRIQKSQYPAEFGGKAAALVNVATRSGTNAFHGSIVEFARSSRFDARNYFDDKTRPAPPLDQHQFGGSLGGPLVRDRSFFFANYEGQRLRKSLTQTLSVPSAALRLGDFSGGAPICDPISIAGSCTPFADNRIPSGRIDPIAQALLARVPQPTARGEVGNLAAVESQRADMDQVSLRLDHRLTSNDQLMGRVTAYRVTEHQPFGTSKLSETLVPGFGRSLTTESRNVALSHTRMFGSRVVNELRFGFLNASGGQFSVNEGIDFASDAGLQGVTRVPRDMGYPQVSFAGLYNTIGDPTSFTTRNNTSFEVYDNVTLERGRHRVRFGGYLFHLIFRPETPDVARGAFAYTGQFTGNALADFLLGYPAAAQVGIGRADEDARTTWVHFFTQDDWAVSSNLTVNAGIRAEVNRHVEDVNNRLSTVDLNYPGGRFVIASDEEGRISPDAQALLSAIPIPWVPSAVAGWDRSLLRPGYRRVAPRLGFAYRLPGAGDTVVRGAFGIFLNQWAYSVQQNLAKNLPFFFTKTVNVASDARVPPYRTATILTTDTLGAIGASIMDWDYRVEYNQTYTLDAQHAISPRTSVELSLMASRTVGADSSTVRNVPLPGPGAINPRRPVPQLGPVNAIRWDGWGLYRAATIRVDHRLSDGLALSANYTISKSEDDASDPGATVAESNLPQNVYDLSAERSVSSYDHRHRLVANGTYALPFFRHRSGVAGALGAGWQVSGIATIQSGAPFTVNLGFDRANIGNGTTQRPDVSGNPNLDSGRNADRWFDTAVFSLPAPYNFGNSPRNSVLGPGSAQVDVVFQKQVQRSAAVRLELRWEIFNLLNRTNFDLPNRIAFTPNFGRIFSAQPPRQMQFGAKLIF